MRSHVPLTLRLVWRVVNRRTRTRRTFFQFGAIPSVENQEEFAQDTERVRGKGGLSEWSSWGKGFWGGMSWLKKGWHGRASF